MNLKELRLKAGLTQLRCANHLEVTEKTYRAYENGDTDIRLSQLRKLINLLGPQISKLLTEAS